MLVSGKLNTQPQSATNLMKIFPSQLVKWRIDQGLSRPEASRQLGIRLVVYTNMEWGHAPIPDFLAEIVFRNHQPYLAPDRLRRAEKAASKEAKHAKQKEAWARKVARQEAKKTEQREVLARKVALKIALQEAKQARIDATEKWKFMHQAKLERDEKMRAQMIARQMLPFNKRFLFSDQEVCEFLITGKSIALGARLCGISVNTFRDIVCRAVPNPLERQRLQDDHCIKLFEETRNKAKTARILDVSIGYVADVLERSDLPITQFKRPLKR